MNKNKAIIVGCGIIGLTSGIRLLEHGFTVTIVACELPPNTTSDVAAAYWYPNGTQPEKKVRAWCRVSHQVFQALAQTLGSGVSFQRYTKLFKEPAPEPPWVDMVDDFQPADCTPYPEPYRYGYQMTLPVIETPIYMPFIKQKFIELGGEIRQATVTRLADLATEAPLIINSSGVGAKRLANDPEVYPIRGQIVRVRKPPSLNSGLLSIGEPDETTYIIPRTQDCLLGGTMQEGNWSLEPDMATASAIIERCALFYPALRHAEVLEHKVGLRPGRPEVRLELEALSPDSVIIHNYGHATIGHTLAWGCAAQVTALALGVRDS